MAQVIWQSGSEVGETRLIIDPLAHNGKEAKSKFVFEKRISNDALGNERWADMQFPIDFKTEHLDKLILSFIETIKVQSKL